HHGGRRAAVPFAPLHARGRERARALPHRRDARRRQLHLERSLQGRQLARARRGGDHADLLRRKDHRVRRERRPQGRRRRPGAGLAGRGGAGDFPRRGADPPGAVPDQGRRPPPGPAAAPPQQPGAPGRRREVGSTRLGAERLRALCDEYGAETMQAAMASLIERTAARVRGELARWPDGEHSAEARLDHDGADRSKPVRVRVIARKAGDRLTLDFSETDAQAKGPVNTPRPTAQAVSLLALIAASDPTIPMNSGVLDAVDFVMPPGTLVNPQFPATVNHYFPTSHVVYTCVLAALGKFNPARAVAPAGFGTGAIAIGYTKGRAGKPTVQYELMVTSLGGTSTHDGASIVLAMNHFTPGTP